MGSRWLRRLGIFAATVAVLGVLAVGAGFGVLYYFSRDLPSVETLRTAYRPPQVTRILARDGTPLAELFTERRTVIPITDLPGHVKLAFLAAEDARFFEHQGVNYMGILRALIANVRAGQTVQGGSTITQQVVKNLVLSDERSLRRKIREALLALELERVASKEEIFHLYLNHIYFGHGRYGIEEAARFYFGKPARELDLSESALLAGLVASPERYSPRKHPQAANGRRAYVLGQMVEKAFISPPARDAALALPVRVADPQDARSRLAPEAVDAAREFLEAVVGEKAALGGYDVTTTIDPGLQAAARKAVRDNLERYAKRHAAQAPFTKKGTAKLGKPFGGTSRLYRPQLGTVVATDDKAGTLTVQVGDARGVVMLADEDRYNAAHLPAHEFAEVGAKLWVSFRELGSADGAGPLRLEVGPEAALVGIDVRTREVRALVGSYEAEAGALDRATDVKRQPGSVFKAFVYSYALHSRRMTPATLLEVPPSPSAQPPPTAPPAELAVPAPPEFEKISVRKALAKSDNTAAVAVFNAAGPVEVVGWAHSMGIESRMEPDLSLPLGAYEVSPLEMTNAYATLASGGEYAPAVLVTRITGPDGQEIPLPPLPPRRRVMERDEAYLATSLLESVVQKGTASRANSLQRHVAGKTGTTNESRDAWFVGYSTDLTVGVWVGFDDNRSLGAHESGATAALPAWIDLMRVAHEGKPSTSFPTPPGIVRVTIDPATGLLAYPGQLDSVDEEFLSGTEPTEVAEPPPPPLPPELGGIAPPPTVLDVVPAGVPPGGEPLPGAGRMPEESALPPE